MTQTAHDVSEQGQVVACVGESAQTFHIKANANAAKKIAARHHAPIEK